MVFTLKGKNFLRGQQILFFNSQPVLNGEQDENGRFAFFFFFFFMFMYKINKSAAGIA